MRLIDTMGSGLWFLDLHGDLPELSPQDLSLHGTRTTRSLVASRAKVRSDGCGICPQFGSYKSHADEANNCQIQNPET